MGAATFLYDGDCAICTTCARFIERRIPTGANVRPWQSVDLETLGVSQPEAEAAVQWIGLDGSVAAGPVAIARLLVDAGSFWRPLGWILDLPPVRALAWPVYRLIARNRDRLPGGTPTCSVSADSDPGGAVSGRRSIGAWVRSPSGRFASCSAVTSGYITQRRKPASASMTSPVRVAASSVTSQATTAAISSGVFHRPRGSARPT
jgi:predicted DCC family thiol-disulfide oxidoreductase YuxK